MSEKNPRIDVCHAAPEWAVLIEEDKFFFDTWTWAVMPINANSTLGGPAFAGISDSENAAKQAVQTELIKRNIVHAKFIGPNDVWLHTKKEAKHQ